LYENTYMKIIPSAGRSGSRVNQTSTPKTGADALGARQPENSGAVQRPTDYVTGPASSAKPAQSTGSSAVAIRLNAPQTTGSASEFRFTKHSGGPINFPLTPGQAAKLRTSNAVSPFLETDPRVVIRPDFLPPPTHPGDEGFWSEFEQVIDFQAARRNGDAAAKSIDLPKLFDGYTMEAAAQAVRSDFPSKWPTALAEQLLGEGAKIDGNIIPQKSNDDFVDGPVLLARIIGWAVSEVSPSAFACKWNQGRARPESVAWAIQTGDLEAPQHIKDKVAQLNLSRPEDFTAYEEGCPRHPSWPAMHSAASCASLYLAVLLDLTPEQIAETRRVDYSVASFRSLAGVHYETDNRAGLALGQEVIAQQLPELLKRFGADPNAVRAKIQRVRHDWYAYEAKTTA
jgi:hypothetical protein